MARVSRLAYFPRAEGHETEPASASAASWFRAKGVRTCRGCLAPASDPTGFETKQVENPAQCLIDHLGKSLGLGVKGRDRRCNHRTHLRECGHRTRMTGMQRRL